MSSPAAAPPPEDFHRLSPLTPVVRGAVLVVGAAVAAWEELLSGRFGPFALVLLAVLVVGFIYGFASWRRTRYWVGPDELRVDTGVLFHQSRRIRIDRLQGIDVVQPFVARLFGLAELRMDTAGGDREGSLAYLPLTEAHQLRETLLARREQVRRSAGTGPVGDQPGDGAGEDPDAAAVAPAWAPPEVEVARLDLGTLLLSVLLSLETLGVVVGAAVVGVATVVSGGLVAVPALPVLGGFVLVQARRLSAYYGFTVLQTSAGLQVRRGLLERSTQTIALARVQGVLLSEPVLWRRLGWARLDVALAGYGGGADPSEGPAATTVMPVAPRALVLRLAAQLLGGADGVHVDPDSVAMSGPARSGRWLDPVAHRFMAAGVGADLVASRDGVLTRRTHLVRHARVQSLRVSQGPLQRRLALADLHVDSPPGPVHVRARNRRPAEARALLEEARRLAREARSASPETGLRSGVRTLGGG